MCTVFIPTSVTYCLSYGVNGERSTAPTERYLNGIPFSPFPTLYIPFIPFIEPFKPTSRPFVPDSFPVSSCWYFYCKFEFVPISPLQICNKNTNRKRLGTSQRSYRSWNFRSIFDTFFNTQDARNKPCERALIPDGI